MARLLTLTQLGLGALVLGAGISTHFTTASAPVSLMLLGLGGLLLLGVLGALCPPVQDGLTPSRRTTPVVWRRPSAAVWLAVMAVLLAYGLVAGREHNSPWPPEEGAAQGSAPASTRVIDAPHDGAGRPDAQTPGHAPAPAAQGLRAAYPAKRLVRYV